jgi:hypothetical protein
MERQQDIAEETAEYVNIEYVVVIKFSKFYKEK